MTTASSVTGVQSFGTEPDDSTDMTMMMMNDTMRQSSMSPTSSSGSNQELIFFITITIAIGIGMIGIGATVHYKVLLYYLKRPKAFILGIVLQLTILPPLAWALTRIFGMTFGESLGVFIQGCSPGGTTSNIVVYWMGGIVDLSVAMTISTTLLSMGTIPLWLLIYEAGDNRGEDFQVPYDRLATSLAVLLVPIFVGMVVRVKVAKHAKLISKIFIVFASIFIVIVLVVRTVLFPIPLTVTWRQAVVAAIMPLIAFALGYLVTLIPSLGLKSRTRKTIGVETSLQNAQVASAIIQLIAGVRYRLLVEMVLFPLLYYIFQVCYSVIFIVIYNVAKRKGWVVEDEERIDVDLSDEIQADDLDMEAKEKEVNQDFENQPKKGVMNPTFQDGENQISAL